MKPRTRRPMRRRSATMGRRRPDPFHGQNAVYLDYKDPKVLERFTNDQGKILPRRLTGLSAKNQRVIVEAIKRARYMAIMPYVGEGLR